MNGPRTLSDQFLSYLVISSKDPNFLQQHGSLSANTNAGNTTADFDLLMCAPHFLGDGTSLHLATHDLLVLLASPLTNNEMEIELNKDVNWVRSVPYVLNNSIRIVIIPACII